MRVRQNADSRILLLIELLALVGVSAVALAIVPEGTVPSWVLTPKTAVFRTVVLLMAMALVVRWAVLPKTNRALLAGTWAGLRKGRARFIWYAVIAFVLANLIATAASPVPAVSIWGVDISSDSYGLFSVIGYVVMMVGVATYLRSAAHIRRLLWVLTSVSVVVSLYAIAQRFGFDPLVLDASPARRPPSTLGNPIFAGSFLVMTIPLTFALILMLRGRWSSTPHLWIGAGLVAPQITAMLMTLSRGNWLGLIAAVAVLAGALFLERRRDDLRRLGAVGIVALAIGLAVVAVPAPGATANEVPAPIAERFGTIASGNPRLAIWRTAADVFLNSPWANGSAELVPPVPTLSNSPLRPLIGYGPNMYFYGFRLAENEPYQVHAAIINQAHNLLVHTVVEIGVLGAVAYLALFAAICGALFQTLRRGGSTTSTLFAVGLLAAVAGRGVEQMTGKAQLPDLLLMWGLVGATVALSRFFRPSSANAPSEADSRSRRPLLRLGVALAVIGAGVWLWTGVVVAPVNGSILVQAGDDLAAKADWAAAGLEFRAAALTSPNYDSALVRIGRWSLERSAQVTGDDARRNVLREGYSAVLQGLRRNPLNESMRSVASELSRELYELGVVSRGEALASANLIAEIMPTFWQAHVVRAWTYISVREYHEAVRATSTALSVPGGDGEWLVQYTRAIAFEGSGNVAAAIEAAEASMALTPLDVTAQLLQHLRDSQAKP